MLNITRLNIKVGGVMQLFKKNKNQYITIFGGRKKLII
jgi:hypothetical protein